MNFNIHISRITSIIGFIGVMLFLVLACGFAFYSKYENAFYSLAVTLPGIYLIIVSREKLEVNETAITRKTIFNSYQISWSEIKSVKTDRNVNAIVFNGNMKRLMVYGPGWYSGSDVVPLFSYVFTRLQQEGKEVATSQMALFTKMKNVKISGDT
jgi:hypothetical protein